MPRDCSACGQSRAQALAFGADAEVIEPQELRQKVPEAARATVNRYTSTMCAFEIDAERLLHHDARARDETGFADREG